MFGSASLLIQPTLIPVLFLLMAILIQYNLEQVPSWFCLNISISKIEKQYWLLGEITDEEILKATFVSAVSPTREGRGFKQDT